MFFHMLYLKNTCTHHQPMPDDGTSDLFNSLKNYHRITLADACRRFLKTGELSIGIWVNERGVWRRDAMAERKLPRLDFKGTQSVCSSIVTQLYGLSPLQYEKIRASFDEERWPSWSGIYEANDAKQRPTFVLVVKLPVAENVVGRTGAGGIAGALGVLTGVGLTTWQMKGKLAETKEEMAKQYMLATNKLKDCEGREQALIAQGPSEKQVKECAIIKQDLDHRLAASEKKASDTDKELAAVNAQRSELSKVIEMWRDAIFDTLKRFIRSDAGGEEDVQTPSQGSKSKKSTPITAMEAMQTEFKTGKWGLTLEKNSNDYKRLRPILLDFVQFSKVQQTVKESQDEVEAVIQTMTQKGVVALQNFYMDVTMRYFRKILDEISNAQEKASQEVQQIKQIANQKQEDLQTQQNIVAASAQRIDKLKGNAKSINQNLATLFESQQQASPQYNVRKMAFDQRLQDAATPIKQAQSEKNWVFWRNENVTLDADLLVASFREAYEKGWDLEEETLRHHLAEYLFAIRRALNHDDPEKIWNRVQPEINSAMRKIMDAGQSAANEEERGLARRAALDDYVTCVTSQYYIEMLRYTNDVSRHGRQEVSPSERTELQKLKDTTAQLDLDLHTAVKQKLKSMKGYDKKAREFPVLFQKSKDELMKIGFHDRNDVQMQQRLLFAPMLAESYQSEFDSLRWAVDKGQWLNDEKLADFLSLYLFTLRRYENDTEFNALDQLWNEVKEEIDKIVPTIMVTAQAMPRDEQAQFDALIDYYTSITRAYYLKVLQKVQL